jgi:hypothetical protein
MKRKSEAEGFAGKSSSQQDGFGCPLCGYKELQCHTHTGILDLYGGNQRSKRGRWRTSIYSRSNQNPRTCILVKKDFWILLLMHYCSRDLRAVKIKTPCGRGPRDSQIGVPSIQ